MPSGKKSKQMRRAAPPPVQSKGATRRRQADPKVLAIGAGVVALVVLAVVLAVVLTRGNGSSIPKDIQPVGSLRNSLPGASDVQAMYKGIPQKGLVLGSAFAPVKMVIYIDLQCPICQSYETTVMPTVISKYVRPGKVRVELKPWAFIGPDSVRGQAATFAAAAQNKAFNFASVLYDNQGTENTGWLDDSMVAQIAESVPGMQVRQLLSDRNSGSVKSQATAVDAAAQADKVSGTPTVLIGKNGTKPALVGAASSAPDLQQTEAALDAALAD